MEAYTIKTRSSGESTKTQAKISSDTIVKDKDDKKKGTSFQSMQKEETDTTYKSKSEALIALKQETEEDEKAMNKERYLKIENNPIVNGKQVVPDKKQATKKESEK
jgi:hypothetical protein